jgi:predicted RNase H-like nuclease (RuvC/YqgF family)
MATTSNSTTVKSLQNTVETQKDQISRLLNRVSDLSDRIHVLTSELNQFKNDVAKDVTYLTQRVDGTT